MAADNNKSIEYTKINSILSLVMNEAESKYIYLNATVKPTNETLKIEDIKLWLSDDNEQKTDILVQQDGVVILPVLTAERAEKTKLNINQPEDMVSLSITTGINPPTEKQVAYRDLFVLLNDSNRFIEKMAGAASWLVPSMDALSFEFESEAFIEIPSKKRSYRFETDDDNKIEIDVKKRLMKENPMMNFSQLPIAMEPVD